MTGILFLYIFHFLPSFIYCFLEKEEIVTIWGGHHLNHYKPYNEPLHALNHYMVLTNHYMP